MNDLTNLPPSSAPSSTTTVELSAGLKSLLAIEPSSERAVREIASTPVMLAEARKVLPALRERATAPAWDRGVQRVIAKQFAVYAQPERTDDEWADFWLLYCDALSDIPESALDAGLRQWAMLPTSQFLPKPGELRQLALTTENRDARAYERARKACEYQPPKTYDNTDVPDFTPRIIRKEPTQADKDRVRHWAAEFVTQARPDSSGPEPRANHGSTDEHGVTAEMRALMARQRESRA